MSKTQSLTLYVLSKNAFTNAPPVPLNSFVTKAQPLLKNGNNITVKYLDQMEDISQDSDILTPGVDKSLPLLAIREYENGKCKRASFLSRIPLRMWFEKHKPDESDRLALSSFHDLWETFIKDERQILEATAKAVRRLDEASQQEAPQQLSSLSNSHMRHC